MSAHADPSNAAADCQVLVVGDGVDALTTAAFLGRAGLSPVVVTTNEYGWEPNRRLVLSGSALTLLSALGIVGDLFASATPIRQWTLRGPDRARTERLTGTHVGWWPFVVTGSAQLRKILRAQLPAGTLRLSKTPRRVVPGEQGVRVEFADGVREEFDVVVGADGARSWVRATRFDGDPPARWGTTTWTVRGDAPFAASAVTELWSRHGVLTGGPGPQSGPLRFVTATVDEPAPGAVRRQLSDPLPLENRTDGEVSAGVTAIDGRVDYGVRTGRWLAGRTALVGAAARSLPPVLSVGPSLTVEDAYVLAVELVNAGSPREALRRYARRRRERYRALARHVPLDGLAPSDRGEHLIREWYPLRVAVLNAFLAERALAPSEAVLASLYRR